MININSINIFKQNDIFCFFTITIFAIYTTIAIKFVWHDGLSSFASDSANYMLMGQYLSPWKDASLAIKSLWPEQDFPPLFPLLIAFTGAAHNMIAAHILTASFLIIALPLIYIFTRQCFATNWQALTITFIFAISPSTWMNTLGILSENIYILISFLVLILIPKIKLNNTRLSLAIGCLIAFLILTRTIGMAMFAAYIITGFFMWKRSEIKITTYFIPIVLVVTINTVAKLFHQSSVPSQYIKQFKDLVFGDQLNALIDAWFSSWQFYWVDNLIYPYAIVLTIGSFACFGLLIRLKMQKFDAVYVIIYLFILLVWPHPGQALRFLYPILALLFIYSFFFIHTIFNRYLTTNADKPIALFLLLMAMVVLPSLSFSYNRYKTGESNGFNHIKEFYRIPDLKMANANASMQLQMFNDMKRIEEITKPNSLILYFEPTYIALLSDRNSQSITFTNENGLFTVNRVKEADYTYLSRLHPRKTRDEINGLDVQAYIKDYTDILWTSFSSENNEPVSIFFKNNN